MLQNVFIFFFNFYVCVFILGYFTTTTTTTTNVQLGTKDLFVTLITKDLSTSYLLPFNLFDVSQDIFIDLVVDDTLLNQTLRSYSNQPYDQSYWNNKNVVALPWFPFFAHCEGYGSRINLFDALEDSTQCVLVPKSATTTIKSIPTSGIDATGDRCRIKLQCQYVEEVNTTYSGTSWFYVTSKAELAYITKLPQNPSDVVTRKSGTLIISTILLLQQLLFCRRLCNIRC